MKGGREREQRARSMTKERGTKVVVSRVELGRLGLDPRVFYELPREVQLEQFASARFEKSFGGVQGKRKKKAG